MQDFSKKTAMLRKKQTLFLPHCRIEETRTPDHHVPNVVRYQLRYYPKAKTPQTILARRKDTNFY